MYIPAVKFFAHLISNEKSNFSNQSVEEIKMMRICQEKSVHIVYYLIVLAVMFMLPPCGSAEDHVSSDTLLADVIGLKLGMNGFILGKILNAEQLKIARQHPVQGAYEGTYKFRNNDLVIVVDQKTDRILAMYRQEKDVDLMHVKSLVAQLMNRFEAPTVMAHEKIIYWAFNKFGSVSEEDFNRAKKVGQTSELAIIGTVKLNSDIEISPVVPQPADSATKEEPPNQKGTVYYIISSDPLIKAFVDKKL